MKKNLLRLSILAVSLMAAFSACSLKDDLPFEDPTAPDGVSLRFFCDDLLQVKSTVDSAGVDRLNENLLASVEYFLYPEGHTGEDAVYTDYLTNVDPTKWNTIPLTEVFINSVLCPGRATTFRVYAIANHPRIVADVPEGQSKDLTGTSVPTLEARTQNIELDSEGIAPTQPKFLMATDGAFQVTGVKKRETTVASGEVKLKRNAAKLSILVHVADSVVITNTVTINNVEDTRNEVWVSRPAQMEIYLVNGAATGQVSGAPLATPSLFTYQAFAFNPAGAENHNYTNYVLKTDSQGHPLDANNQIIDENNDADLVFLPQQKTGSFLPSTSPFYTYPVSWEYGSADEPYLKLMIPWDRKPGVSSKGTPYGSVSKSYYYRIYCPGSPIDGSHAQFLRNNWYKILLNVSILGSEADGGMLQLTGSYYVVDWQERSQGQGGEGQGQGVNDSDKEAEIKGARFLFLNKEEYFLYNVDDLSIPYVTSDPCEIVNATATKYVFSGTDKTTTHPTNDISEWGITLEPRTTQDGAHVYFYHELNNDTSGRDYDVSEYTITFTLRQSSNTSYAKQIIIHQYPAIMIDMQPNSGNNSNYGYAFVNASNGSNYGESYFTHINAYYTTTSWGRTTYHYYWDEWAYWLGSAPNGATGTNKNLNMFLIETTVLPNDSEYMLGDPRTTYIDNINDDSSTWPNSSSSVRGDTAGWSHSGASVEGGNRQLKYYYPTDNSHSADNIIAPSFRIASSYGVTYATTYANAFRRCASYQEDGRPAGRWRLPTVAEIQYIAKLNADGKIKRLLGDEAADTTGAASYSTDFSEYWCNSGYMVVYDGLNSDWAVNGYSIPKPVLGTDSFDNSTRKSVRCVYDDWYWSTSTYATVSPLTTFKWGDVSRSN